MNQPILLILKQLQHTDKYEGCFYKFASHFLPDLVLIQIAIPTPMIAIVTNIIVIKSIILPFNNNKQRKNILKIQVVRGYFSFQLSSITKRSAVKDDIAGKL